MSEQYQIPTHLRPEHYMYETGIDAGRARMDNLEAQEDNYDTARYANIVYDGEIRSGASKAEAAERARAIVSGEPPDTFANRVVGGFGDIDEETGDELFRAAKQAYETRRSELEEEGRENRRRKNRTKAAKTMISAYVAEYPNRSSEGSK